MTDKRDTRDHELDTLLQPLRKIHPTSKNLQEWQDAVRAAHKPRSRFRIDFELLNLSQLAATLALGFILGAITFYHRPPSTISIEKNSEPSATIERIYAKAD